MRLAGFYLNDHQVLRLADRLRNFGLDDAADQVTAAHHRDASELELAVEPATLTAALKDGRALIEGSHHGRPRYAQEAAASKRISKRVTAHSAAG